MVPPEVKPKSACFSSGPCAKSPSFNEFPDENKVLGRSHRAAVCKQRINKCTSETLRLLGCPEGYKAGIVPASDTGAVEMIIWSLLGGRDVDVFHYESFGTTWLKDIEGLGLSHNSYPAEYGDIPDFSKADFKNDVIFPWNGTTSGARVRNADWIADDREGLTICDATSAVFSMEMQWEKLDITTFSWQKALGGEAAHGVIIFSPRALERIREAKALRPLPKIFKILGKTVDAVCAGDVINTVSMMCIEDCLSCLKWVDSLGGYKGTVQRTNENYNVVKKFVEENDWINFLASDESCRSTTSVCLTLQENGEPMSTDKIKKVLKQLDEAGIGHDLGAYRDAPAGLRIWCGATVCSDDVAIVLQWLKYYIFEGEQPAKKTACPNFSSGPCAKPPVFNWYRDENKVLGRSHRAAVCKQRINKCTSETLRLLGCPEGYKAGIVPASDTGAVEMIIWSLLGGRDVDVFHYESFGTTWLKDIEGLGLSHNSYPAEYGDIPDFSKADFKNDVIFPWNGTTSGARVGNADWIADDREGLTICDATSAVFSMEMQWEKLDITTFSWQKALGGEAAHGVIIFSPRALERIREAKALRPLPKIFKILGKTVDAVCAGDVINTVSMMCIEDCLSCLKWVDSLGGYKGTVQRTNENYNVVKKFVEENDWINFLASDESCRSTTSVCLTLQENGEPMSTDKIKKVLKQLDEAGIGHDLGAYRDAPAGLRIWCGATVCSDDVAAMLQWLKVCNTQHPLCTTPLLQHFAMQ